MASTQFVRTRQVYEYSEAALALQLRNNLRVGDVILTSDSTEVLRPIVAFQNKYKSFPAASRKFTHVALYAGDGQIIHSMPFYGSISSLNGGVAEVPITDLLHEGILFTVLRYPGLIGDLGSELVDGARHHVGKPYDYTAITRVVGAFAFKLNRDEIRVITDLAEKAKAMVPGETPTPIDYGRAMICSDFVFTVYDELFQERNPCNYPGGDPGLIKLPCSFYANPNFCDVFFDLKIPVASDKLGAAPPDGAALAPKKE